jgi:hypothetical protein
MKSKFLKSSIIENKQRCSVALLLFVCLGLCALIPGAAQLRNQRRVTALQLGDAGEGSRVTVVSDSPLSDYEAFRRGDRFYVKIPLADFTSASPHFRGDGFEDVQVQRVGDGLIVSFKLQPGSTARVDQRGNRLDVIFSAPNRSSYNAAANADSNRGMSREGGRDAAGPMPPGTLGGFRDRVVTTRAADRNYNPAPQNPWVPTNAPRGLNANSRRAGRNPAMVGSASVPSPRVSPSPGSSPQSVLAPATSAYTPPTNATATVTPNKSAVSSSGSGVTWKQRGNSALHWASANRLATLLGALILVSLILYLVMALRNRQTKVGKAKQTKAPKVQPKYSPDSALSESSQQLTNEQTALDVKKGPASPPASAPTVAEATPSHQWQLTKPTIASPTGGHDEHSSDEEEREVFEL